LLPINHPVLLVFNGRKKGEQHVQLITMFSFFPLFLHFLHWFAGRRDVHLREYSEIIVEQMYITGILLVIQWKVQANWEVVSVASWLVVGTTWSLVGANVIVAFHNRKSLPCFDGHLVTL
jgi:hypothetical protein